MEIPYGSYVKTSVVKILHGIVVCKCRMDAWKSCVHILDGNVLWKYVMEIMCGNSVWELCMGIV